MQRLIEFLQAAPLLRRSWAFTNSACFASCYLSRPAQASWPLPSTRRVLPFKINPPFGFPNAFKRLVMRSLPPAIYLRFKQFASCAVCVARL